MIPTLKISPTVAGQESGVPNSSQAQEKSGSEGNSKAFGDVLNSQEPSKKSAADSKTTKVQESEGGNNLHENGKQLPGDKVDSNVKANNANTNAPSQASADIDNTGDLTHQSPVQTKTLDLTELVDDLTITHQRADWIQQFSGKQGSYLDNKRSLPDATAFSRTEGSLTEKSLLASISAVPVSASPSVNSRASVISATVNSIANATTTNTNIAPLDGAKIDLNSLQSGLLNSDDLAAIQQALGGDATKEKLMLDTVSLKAVSSLQAQVSSQAPVPSPTAIVSHAGMSQAEPGLVSDIKTVASNLTMSSALGTSGWDGEFLGRVNMLIKGGIQEAKIQLSPPEMGRLEIKVSTEGDSAKIMFSVDNIAAKDAIEQAIPRLRELLEQGGLQLAHSEVADHSQSNQGQGDVDETALGSDLAQDTEGDGEEGNSWQLGISLSNSTVDYYI